jgi:uncharacterized protein with GYD domain
MAKYLFIGQYTAEGAKGVLKEGGSARKAVAEKVMTTAGGTFESIHWGFGADDFYVIADLPSSASAAAAALTVSASGRSGFGPSRS